MKHITYTVIAEGNLGFPAYSCGGSIAAAINEYVRATHRIASAVRTAQRQYGTITPVVAPEGWSRTWEESVQDEPSVGIRMLMFNESNNSTRCVRM